MQMDLDMLSKSSKASKIMPKIKTIIGEEPLEWQKNTIGRQKPKETLKKLSIIALNSEMHSNRQMWLINGLDFINESQSVVAIGGFRADHMKLAMAIGGVN